MNSITDQQLVKAAQNNDLASFDQLVKRYKDMVFNLCYRFMGDLEEANDCAQDTFLKAYKGIKNFRQEANFSTWLYRIAVNTCKNSLATLAYRLGKSAIRIDQPAPGSNNNQPKEIADPISSPANDLIKKEQEELIQKAIDSLPAEQKIVVILRDIQDLSYEEVAEISGYNIGTVKSKLFRAREALRKKLEGQI